MIIAIIITAIIFVVFAFLFYIFDTAFYNPPGKRNKKVELGEQYLALIDKLDEQYRQVIETDSEQVEIKSYDGTLLRGKYYHFKDGVPVDIIFHGYRSKAENDCGGGFVLARDLGHNVLLPDQRAHSASGGNVITFGIKERYDCLEWIKYISERFNDVKIVISGVSMGAATVLMASDLDLPKNVKGIIADCAYSSPEEIIMLESKKMGFSQKIAKPFILFTARVLGGFDLRETSPCDALKNAKIPVLVIHGEDDRFVPFSMCKPIYEACATPKKLFTVKGAGHGLSYLVDEEGYKNEVNKFKTAVLNDDFSYFA